MITAITAAAREVGHGRSGKGASSDTIAGKGKGGGLFPLYYCCGGNDANYSCYRCKEDSRKRHFSTSSWEREKGRVVFPPG